MSLGFQKVVIWGYPLNSHTHSYVHHGWYKGFKHMGFDTHWFDDNQYPSNFDFTNTLFITEGYADKNIPLDKSNIYCVHVAIQPKKYLNIGARFIDLRYNVLSIKDCNYIYDLSTKEIEKISDVVYYEKEASDRDLNPRFRYHSPLKYEAVYIAWATDLLPEEICLQDRFIEPEQPPVSYFIGSIGGGNAQEVHKFATACSLKGIHFIHNNPWSTPLTFEEAKTLVQKSYVCPDIRGAGDADKIRMGETGTCHKQIGYIPCRLFKNISYGKLGLTNCPRLKELFGNQVILQEDESKMVDTYLEYCNNKDYVQQQMIWVRDNHTYINRIQDLLKVIQKC